MQRKVIHTDRAPAAVGPYSQAIRAGDLVYCSGQIALDPATGQLVGEGDVRAQTRQAMDNIGAVLEAAGSGFDKVIKCNLYLTEMGDFAAVNEEYGRYFDGMEPPARAAIGVASLPKDALFEVELVAFV